MSALYLTKLVTVNFIRNLYTFQDGIIIETDTQCRKVVNITTTLKIYSHG